ncbi:MAG: MFS transporter [Gammaproteobacteria bacterium]|nr:MFS transporter [Gammaproteobacteria bacterium]NIP89075.1 MFS transporter [Gammaproteobacteria bacterium]NIR23939.1 MFS transporter [Gammaproteobacteria bacterium]NIS05573.1 MFS transporter [Gammaproteobacteria bacterium]NIU40887.1 MFS transporter [Gammaproteobacteria bacterium]
MWARLGALHSPLYRRYWFGSLASIGATQLLILGKGWLVYELSGSPLKLGLLGAAGAVPQILVSLFGGVLADRLDKRRVLMATSMVIALLLALLSALDFTGVVEVWHVILIAALIGFTSGLDWPARQAFFTRLIDREHMTSAVALNSILWQSTRMIVPAIGGIVIALSSTAVVFLAAALGFLTMFLVLVSLDVTHRVTPRGDPLQQFLEGLKFIGSTRLFAIMIPLTWVLTFFGVSYIQLMPAFADILGVDERGFGFLLSASGVGSVTGTALVVFVQHTRRLGWLIIIASLCSTLALFGFSITTGFAEVTSHAYAIAMSFVLLTSLFNSMYLISSMTVLQMRVPDELRGRVMGIHGITFSLIPLGALFGGSVASAFTPPIAVAAGAFIMIVTILSVALSQDEIRNLRGQ